MIINLIGFLIIPLIGIMALILNNYTKSTSQKNITIISMCSTAVLFLVGLVYGFGGFDVSLVQSLDFSFSLVTNSEIMKNIERTVTSQKRKSEIKLPEIKTIIADI